MNSLFYAANVIAHFLCVETDYKARTQLTGQVQEYLGVSVRSLSLQVRCFI